MAFNYNKWLEEFDDEPLALFLADFYKFGHHDQYPPGTKQVWSNWTPRSTRVEGRTEVVAFGLQYYCIKYLIHYWNKNFFQVPLNKITKTYKDFILNTIGTEPSTDHIEALWREQKLPIKIYALPEGTVHDIKIPEFVVTNTVDHAFWLPNMIESNLSNILWGASTSATTVRDYRKISMKWARVAGERDFGFVDWQNHDFSYRGLMGTEAAELSGMGHLTGSKGTDTAIAIWAAQKYYGAGKNVGGSIFATEHSVMCAGGQESEEETFRRLIEDVYPHENVSIVSDTWDLWKVLTEIIPNLKEKILKRNGNVVIRPDSGDPVKIMIGDPSAYAYSNQYYGVISLLQRTMGLTNNLTGHFPYLNKVRAIYGDSITLDRADKILEGVVGKGLSPFNVALGIGSYTYQYTTRDVNGYAMKATCVMDYLREIIPIWKKPITDSGIKNSLRGIPTVWKNINDALVIIETKDPAKLDKCDGYELVFEDSELLVFNNFESDIRPRAQKGI